MILNRLSLVRFFCVFFCFLVLIFCTQNKGSDVQVYLDFFNNPTHEFGYFYYLIAQFLKTFHAENSFYVVRALISSFLLLFVLTYAKTIFSVIYAAMFLTLSVFIENYGLIRQLFAITLILGFELKFRKLFLLTIFAHGSAGVYILTRLFEKLSHVYFLPIGFGVGLFTPVTYLMLKDTTLLPSFVEKLRVYYTWDLNFLTGVSLYLSIIKNFTYLVIFFILNHRFKFLYSDGSIPESTHRSFNLFFKLALMIFGIYFALVYLMPAIAARFVMFSAILMCVCVVILLSSDAMKGGRRVSGRFSVVVLCALVTLGIESLSVLYELS